MPTHTDRSIRTPRALAMSAAQTGCVATSAVAEATVVKRSDGTQVAKCAPRSRPLTMMSFHWRLDRRRNSLRARKATQTPVAPEPMKQRQKAIASAGATVAVMSGPEADTNAIAMPIHRTSIRAGRVRLVRGLPPKDGSS
ncbi:unannotated protein [freshwater metagenome]|uniref:Unannotated protein n=1 Tax=freshwater metagenome TaxID=449393 RepID=A0A6J6U5T3_9ZZZZ